MNVTAPMIVLSGLQKSFETKAEAVPAIRDVSFEVGAGEVVTLLGPSGCGKTTTLRCVAGLERATAGRISIGGQPVVDVANGVFLPPHKRNLGMVFQSYAIWPHMNVLENVAYALEGRKLDRETRRHRAMRALETVRMAHLADRPATRLSGGQQQRVAIARALVGQPRALLFDEPLSNLDAALRIEMRKELRRLQQQAGLTSIYVTHDQVEALAISDWIILMRDGAIVERGRPIDIYRRPKSLFAAQFLGTTNVIDGVVSGLDGASVRVDTRHGSVTGMAPDTPLALGASVAVSVRPEVMDLVADRQVLADHLNTISGVVELIVFAGGSSEAEIRCGELNLACYGRQFANLAAGEAVTLSFSPRDTQVLSAP